jgi:streptogramin lyase
LRRRPRHDRTVGQQGDRLVELAAAAAAGEDPGAAAGATAAGATARSQRSDRHLLLGRRIGSHASLDGGSIAQAGDGALWFSGGFVPNQIGRMSSAGVVSYPVLRAAGLMSFNPGPLTRGPDGNVWFCDPLAGITLAGTIGMVDIATNVATEFPTPLMKTTIQIREKTSQDQSCETATAVCTPVPTGTCVARAPTPGTPASGPIPAVPPDPGSTCRTVTTGPTLVAACTPIAPVAGNGYTTTTCPTTTVGPTSVDTCTLTPPDATNNFVRTVCTGITPGSQAYLVVTGPDGNLWFTEYTGLRIGVFNATTKMATEFGPLQSPATSLAAGPDGNVWFAERSLDGLSTTIGRVTPAGAITEYKTTPVVGLIRAMSAGADGNVWFVKDGQGRPRGRQDRSRERDGHALFERPQRRVHAVRRHDTRRRRQRLVHELLRRPGRPRHACRRDQRICRGRSEHAAERDHQWPPDRRREHALGHRPDQQIDREADAALAAAIERG